MRFALMMILVMTCTMAHAQETPFRGFEKLKKPLDVSSVSLLDSSSKPASLTGSWVLLNTWATWCAPCVAELPTLDKLAKTKIFPQLKMVAVSLDVGKSPAQIDEFLKQHAIGTFAGYTDPTHKLETTLKNAGLPMTFVVNPQGQIVAQYRGAANWIDPVVFQDLSLLINTGKTSKTSPTKP